MCDEDLPDDIFPQIVRRLDFRTFVLYVDGTCFFWENVSFTDFVKQISLIRCTYATRRGKPRIAPQIFSNGVCPFFFPPLAYILGLDSDGR